LSCLAKLLLLCWPAVIMGVIWNLLSLAKSAKQAVGSMQGLQGHAARCQGALNQYQNNLVQKDYERARAGILQAQFEMGERYFQGLGVPKDYAQAVAWFREAANHGHTAAQGILAMMYFLGRGVAADPAEAYKWAILAASTGDTEAVNTQRQISAKISAEAKAEGEQRAIRAGAPHA
jgi:TPR repeat protein